MVHVGKYAIRTLRIQSLCQMMIGMYNHLLGMVFRFHFHSQEVIGSEKHVRSDTWSRYTYMNGLIFVVNLGKYAIRRWYRFVLSMAFSPFHVPFLLGEPPPPQHCRIPPRSSGRCVQGSFRSATKFKDGYQACDWSFKIRPNCKENGGWYVVHHPKK